MTTDDEKPRPATRAIQPPGPKDVRNGALTAAGLLLAGVLGLLMWVEPSLANVGDWRTQSNAAIIALAFPLSLVAGCWFAVDAVRDWRLARRFAQGKQRAKGVITHLWRGEKDGRKEWLVGFEYGEGHSAFQPVHKLRYNTLTEGHEVWVDYLPDDPAYASFEPVRRAAKSSRRKRSDDDQA
jgi:hypothetical protein